MKEISRRDFLKGALFGAGAIIGGEILVPTTIATLGATALSVDLLRQVESQIDIDNPLTYYRNVRIGLLGRQTEIVPSLTEWGAERIIRTLDKYADALEGLTPEGPQTIKEAEVLALEVIPYFTYEGMRTQSRSMGGPPTSITEPEVWPKLQMVIMGGTRTFHILGVADCGDPKNSAVGINVRFYNPYSPWHEKGWLQVSTLVHELGHTQDVSCTAGADMETATQLATIEVLAGMARHGNKWALLPFIREVQGFAYDRLYLQHLNKGERGFRTFRRVIEENANNYYDLTKFDKSVDFWRPKRGELVEILDRYGSRPHIYLSEALNTAPLLLTRPLPMQGRQGNIRMDDVAYVLRNMEKMVVDYPKL